MPGAVVGVDAGNSKSHNERLPVVDETRIEKGCALWDFECCHGVSPCIIIYPFDRVVESNYHREVPGIVEVG